MQHVNRAGSCSWRCCCFPLPVAVLRLWTKQILFAHTLSKSFAIATGYGHAPHPRGTGREKLHVCDFHLVRVYLIHPHPSYCSLGSLFVSSLFVRRKYPARGRDASMSSGHRHDELLSDGIRVCSSQIVKLSNCMSIYSLTSIFLPLP